MSFVQSVVTILAVALGTILTRFLPFLIFPEGKTPPAVILYLGKVLPCAAVGLLVVYSKTPSSRLCTVAQRRLLSRLLFFSTSGKRIRFLALALEPFFICF